MIRVTTNEPSAPEVPTVMNMPVPLLVGNPVTGQVYLMRRRTARKHGRPAGFGVVLVAGVGRAAVGDTAVFYVEECVLFEGEIRLINDYSYDN